MPPRVTSGASPVKNHLPVRTQIIAQPIPNRIHSRKTLPHWSFTIAPNGLVFYCGILEIRMKPGKNVVASPAAPPVPALIVPVPAAPSHAATL